MQYELFYLVGESKKSELPRIQEEIKKTVAEAGGVFVDPQITKERKMSYQVKKDIRGIYIAQRFNVADKDAENFNPAAISNLNKKLNLNPDILRFLMLNAAELPELKEKEASPVKTIKTDKRPETRTVKEFRGGKIKAEEKKEQPKEQPTEAEVKKEAEVQEDIDKRLDEILNI